MKYLNKEEFLAQYEQMQLSSVIYNTAEVLEWDPKSFLESYEKWIEFNEEELMSDSYGHATVSVCEKVREMLWNLRFLYANEKGIPGPFEGVFPEARRPNIFGDEIAFVEKWNFSRANLNEKNRIMAITQVASICYQSGKSLGSESLYNRLLAESHGLPSSSFEFVPMLLSEKEYWEHVETKLPDGLDINNQLTKFGEWIEDNGKKYLLTNFRAAVYMKEYYPDIDLTGFYNTEAECEIIARHFSVFLYKVDFPTRSQMVRHRVNWQELCISGESKITTLQGKRTIKKLYDNQFRKSSNKLPKVRTYDFNEKRLVWSEIKEVFSTGKKPVYEVVIQTGVKGNKLKIKSTENHKFLTLDGWKELKDISVGGFVATNIQPLCKKCHVEKTLEENELNDHTYTFNFVESITLIGEEDTYDLEVEHPDHNYVANGIIVHNSRRYVSGKRVPFDFYVSEKMKDITSEAGDTQKILDICLEHYYKALEDGVKPQEARRIIPQAGYSQIWGAFQPTQLANYFRLRDDSHAQWEIHQTAIAMKEMIISLAALKEDMADPERQAEIARRIQSIKDGTCGVIGTEELEQMLAEREDDRDGKN